MQMKDSTALDNESDLVFIVLVFAIELRKHRIQTRRVWMNIDDIRGDVAALRLQTLNFLRICTKNGIGGGFDSS
jgi:hypothetical protein